MAEIVIENAVKRFGKFIAIDNVSLTVYEHEFLVLLGPSGCGKTTLLRAIAGLGMLDSGRIIIDGKDVTYNAPRDRGISMVFQNYAIFPHMKVFDNIAFGLKMKKVPKPQIEERVHNAAKLLHIESMLDRYPSQMSGGQRQRIAVARAIAVESGIVLMDEPLSNLDALLRLEMRAELKTLLKRLGVTTIYVTHDQIEAMSMGDRIAVMRSGKILQLDPPTTVYDLPVDQFVGGFIGTPPMNFLHGRVSGNGSGYTVQLGDFTLTPPAEMQPVLSSRHEQPILIGIRAECMEPMKTASPDAIPVTIDVVEPLGAQNLLTARIGEDTIKVSTHPDFTVAAGDTIWLRFPESKVRYMDVESGRALSGGAEKVMA
ncbi:ABC transporter ATP-binding protein [Anaerolineae bacterium CFX9]|jgi:multiple sugar transport system ATP-binding protein|nr:ABC transporter ATP-binding protein [Anaerolineae bacterium CFX9]